VGKSGGEWTGANVGLPAIFIGNHFTLDDLALSYASEQARKLDKILIALDRLYWVQSQEPHFKLAHFSQGNPRLEFKFGSSFEGILKVTDERLDGVKIYRSIIIDILLYTQKLLADFSIEIRFGNIRMDDLNVLRKWRKGPSSILLWIGVLHHTKEIVDHIFKSRNLNIFSKSNLATIFLEYEIYWLEYYYPREFYSVVTFRLRCISDLKPCTMESRISSSLDCIRWSRNKTARSSFPVFAST